MLCQFQLLQLLHKPLLSVPNPTAKAYTPDLARNVLTLLDAPDDVYGQAWQETTPVDWNRRITITAVIAVLVMAIGLGYSIWSSRQQSLEQRFVNPPERSRAIC